MVNSEKQYLFYNVYGDADHLVASKEASIVAVPWGPDEQTEVIRNQTIDELGITPSALPSLIFWMPVKKEWSYIADKPYQHVIPPHWEEFRISDMDKPWDWATINQAVQTLIEAVKEI